MKKFIFLIPVLCFAQANPTESTFNASQFNQLNQVNTAAVIIVNLRQSQTTICPFNSFMGVDDYKTSVMTQNGINAITDIIQQMSSCLMINLDVSPFITGSGLTTTLLDGGFLHILADNLNVQLNLTWGSGAGSGVSSPATVAACNNGLIAGAGCVTTPAPCTVANPCISNFADFQTYALGASGPYAQAILRWCAPTSSSPGIGALCKWLNFAHEWSLNYNGQLNPTWNGTSNGQGSASDWLGFANAAVTLVRAYTSGQCTSCATMDLSMTALGSGLDMTTNYATICGSSSHLTSCGVDLYPTPTGGVGCSINCLNQYLQLIEANAADLNELTGKGFFFQETHFLPSWVPNYSPQGETNAYKGNMSQDWVQNKTASMALNVAIKYASAFDATRMGIFDLGTLISIATQPSCPNFPSLPANCTAPDPNCGNDGTQCGGDIWVLQPAWVQYGLTLVTNSPLSLNQLGQHVRFLNNQWMTGAH